MRISHAGHHRRGGAARFMSSAEAAMFATAEAAGLSSNGCRSLGGHIVRKNVSVQASRPRGALSERRGTTGELVR
jgi:hypothetical protein